MPEEMGSAPERLAWRVHPAAERRGTGIAVLALMITLSALAAMWMEGAYWGLFAFGVLFLSLEAFFLPARFELSEEGVTVRKAFSRVERPWGQFRRVIFDPVGVTLSPFARRHWLEAYRGTRLRFARPAAGRDTPAPEEVRRFILAHIDLEEVRVVGLPEVTEPDRSVERGADDDDGDGRRADQA